MARRNFILETLLEKGEITWKPHGNSMTPKIDSGDQVVVKKVPASACRVGDAVYAKVKGNYYLHLLSAIDETHGRYQISNNHGHVNGWVNADNIFGVCVKVKDKILISDEELAQRQGQYTRQEAEAWSKEEDKDTPSVLAWNDQFNK